MGEIAKSNADSVVVTSDNPRTESPQKIIQDILVGSSKDVIVEVDRRKAINRAIGGAGEDDIVLIAGKGHENYQILGVERLPFSDQSKLDWLYVKSRQVIILEVIYDASNVFDRCGIAVRWHFN